MIFLPVKKPTQRQLDRLNGGGDAFKNSIVDMMEELRRQGVSVARVVLDDNVVSFSWTDGTHVEGAGVVQGKIAVAPVADKKAALVAIGEAKVKGFDYSKFQHDLAASGINSYVANLDAGLIDFVDLSGNTVATERLRLGEGEELVHPNFPEWLAIWEVAGKEAWTFARLLTSLKQLGVKAYQFYLNDVTTVIYWNDGHTDELNESEILGVTSFKVASKLDEREVKSAFDHFLAGKTTIRVMAKRLAESGVASYRVDIIGGEAVFFGTNRANTTSIPVRLSDARTRPIH